MTAAASIISRLSGLASLVVVGWFLTEEQLGVFAIAVGITTFTLILRGGGSELVIQSMAPGDFKQMGGGLPRTTLAFAIVGIVLTLACAVPAMRYYDQPTLGATLLWLAAALFVFQIGAYQRSKVGAALQFRALAVIEIATAVAKLVAAYWCASHGWGPMTLGIAQLVGNSIQFVGVLVIADLGWNDLRVKPGWIRPMILTLRLPIVLSVMTTVSLQIDTFLASFFAPVASLGVYYFAKNIAVAPVLMLIGAVRTVLAPYAARARGNPKLERENIEAAFAFGSVFAPLALMFLTTIYPSLSRMLWGDKWAASVWPVTLGTVLLVYPTIQGLLEGPVMGLRVWTEYMSILSWRSASKAVGCIGGFVAIWALALPTEATALALTIGVGAIGSVVAFFQIRSFLSRFGIDREMVTFELHSPTIYSVLAVIATHGLASGLMDSIAFLSIDGRQTAAIECALCAVIYLVIALALLRFAYIARLKVMLAIVPAPVRARLCRIMLIPETAVEAVHD